MFCLHRPCEDTEEVRQAKWCSHSLALHPKGLARAILHDRRALQACERVRDNAGSPLLYEQRALSLLAQRD